MNKSQISTFLVLALAYSSNAFSAQCKNLFSDKNLFPIEKIEDSEKLISLKNSTTQLLSSDRFKLVFSGSTEPRWNDYNDLLQLQKLILGNQEKNKIKFLTPIEIILLKIELAPFVDHIIHSQNLINKSPEERKKYNKFLDTHFAWFKLIESINESAGFNIFPDAGLSKLPTTEKLKQDGADIVRRLEKVFNKTFSNTGHKDFAEFEKYLRAFSDEAVKKYAVTKNKLVVAMHRPESARFWIPISGFQNQRATGSTGGYKGTEGRDRGEANLTGLNIEDYVPLSNRLKANYAEARPDVSVSEYKPITAANLYGTDIWVFKKDVAEKRATWTPEDSLSPAWRDTAKNIWDSHVIPWKFRSLITPYWLNKTSTYKPDTVPNDFKLELNNGRWSKRGIYYFEVQIWGPSSIDDIQSFIFQKTPPDKNFYELLKSKNIEVWDERTWPAKPYHGKESL
jgi:hypothetical protein